MRGPPQSPTAIKKEIDSPWKAASPIIWTPPVNTSATGSGASAPTPVPPRSIVNPEGKGFLRVPEPPTPKGFLLGYEFCAGCPSNRHDVTSKTDGVHISTSYLCLFRDHIDALTCLVAHCDFFAASVPHHPSDPLPTEVHPLLVDLHMLMLNSMDAQGAHLPLVRKDYCPHMFMTLAPSLCSGLHVLDHPAPLDCCLIYCRHDWTCTCTPIEFESCPGAFSDCIGLHVLDLHALLACWWTYQRLAWICVPIDIECGLCTNMECDFCKHADLCVGVGGLDVCPTTGAQPSSTQHEQVVPCDPSASKPKPHECIHLACANVNSLARNFAGIIALADEGHHVICVSEHLVSEENLSAVKKKLWSEGWSSVISPAPLGASGRPTGGTAILARHPYTLTATESEYIANAKAEGRITTAWVLKAGKPLLHVASVYGPVDPVTIVERADDFWHQVAQWAAVHNLQPVCIGGDYNLIHGEN
eukprot:1989683-Amphidinium_carterae.1